MTQTFVRGAATGRKILLIRWVVLSLAGQWLNRFAGMNMVHVPYKGGTDARNDLLRGLVQISFENVTTAISNANTGKVRLLATVTPKRISALPSLPTMMEQGVPIGLDGFLGFFGQAGMSPAVVQAVTHELSKAISTPEVKKAIVDSGYEPGGMPKPEFAKLVRTIHDRWGEVIRDIDIKLD